MQGSSALAVRKLVASLLIAGSLLACHSGDGHKGKSDAQVPAAGGGGSNAHDSGVTNLFDASTGPCSRDAGCGPIAAGGGKLDVLFIVDNSSSMNQEQDALRREFPRMIKKLVTGDHDQDGKKDHMPITDLHLGVVSSDMGTPTSSACDQLPSDDGLLLHEPNRANDPTLTCKPSYPLFLSYQGGVPTPDALSDDFGCIASLGTSGCGFEQHLESSLKALWPSSDPRLTFLDPTDSKTTLGHGDLENAGFLRVQGNDPAQLVIVVVADEDDCSVYDPTIFDELSSTVDSSLNAQPLNLRCFYNHDKLQPLARYVFGFQHLGARRVHFAAIVGVPVDLTNFAARSKVDFTISKSRDAYYDEILNDPRMRETPMDLDAAPLGILMPACHSALGDAAPARRFVQLAKQFGENSLVQSICGDDFGPPLDTIIEQITEVVD